MRALREIVRASDTVELIRHELSTPVATALLYIGIAESYARHLPTDVITPALDIVRSEVQRLKALIDTMTELQRSGRPALRPRFLDIGVTVRGTVKRLLTTFAGTERVTIVGPPHTIHGWWDPTAVEQIVTNLLTNALKFGQGRAVRLRVRASACSSATSTRRRSEAVAAGSASGWCGSSRSRTAAASRSRAAKARAPPSPSCCARSRRRWARSAIRWSRASPRSAAPSAPSRAGPRASRSRPTGRRGWPSRRPRWRCWRAARPSSRRPRR